MTNSRILVTIAVGALTTACGLIVGLKDRPLYDAGFDASDDAGDAGSGDASCNGNFQTDDKNCGQCGHSCLGGKCSSGVCQPVVVGATGLDGGSVRSITVDGPTIFYGTGVGFLNGTVERCPTSGCTLGTVLATIPSAAQTIATAGGRVYWNEVVTAGPNSVSVDGGAVTALETGNLPSQVLVDNGHLYWSDGESPDTPVRTCTPPNCGANFDSDVTTLLPNGSSAIAISGTTLYAAQEATNYLRFCTIGSCTNMVDVGVNKQADGLTADDNFLYFTDLISGVWRCPARSACGTPTAVALGEATPSNILVDGTFLYWTNNSSSLRVCKLPAPCTTSNTLTYSGNVHGLAFDSVAIYFGNGPAVMRVAKPN